LMSWTTFPLPWTGTTVPFPVSVFPRRTFGGAYGEVRSFPDTVKRGIS
jgi:hypothetical protein